MELPLPRCRRQPTAMALSLTALLCTLLVVLHLVLMHAGHRSPATPHAGAMAALVPGHAVAVGAAATHAVTHADWECPIPSVIAPTVTVYTVGSSAIVLLIATLLPVLKSHAHAPASAGPRRRGGPARQALLQRFIL